MFTAMRRTIVTLLLVVGVFASGCGVGMESLMPTPVLYTEVGLDPLANVPEHERWTPRLIYYATTRARDRDFQKIAYANTPGDEMALGLALIGFGGRDMTWSDLRRVSTQSSREAVVDLSIAGIIEAGTVPIVESPSEAARAGDVRWLLENLSDAIGQARDKDVLIYVHGAKVNFYNACAFTAQLDHFMGRDMTSVAFSWPTRQNIFSYAFGSDVRRAYDSGAALATLIELLAMVTPARRIHVLCWSAGGRVTTRALTTLRERHPDEDEDDLRARLRIGTVYFAAADVPRAELFDALPVFHPLVDRVVVTVSSHDDALGMSARIMGGGTRIGQASAPLAPEQVALLESYERLEVVHVSLGHEQRGFDITGHRYWFRHPWASSDVILSIRGDLPPRRRGLEQGTSPVLWYMPADYPSRLRESLSSVTPMQESVP